MSDIKSFEDWHGELPKNCNLCTNDIGDTFIDGRRTFGSWAIMCPVCFKKYGVGLGTGKRQMYLKGSKADILYEGRDYDASVKDVNEPDHDLEYHDKKCEEANNENE